MDFNTRLERLRDVFHGEPTTETWSRLCLQLHQWPREQHLDLALSYADQHLIGWPDQVRTCPLTWWSARVSRGSEPRLKIVRALRLGDQFGLGGVQRLAWTTELSRLSILDIRRAYIGPEGLEALLASPHLTHLQTLRLDTNWLLDESIPTLLAWPHVGGLRRLSLADNRLTDAGALELAASPALAHLEGLDLSDNAIAADGTTALVSSPNLDALTDLDLKRNPVGPLGAALLADSSRVTPEGRRWWGRLSASRGQARSGGEE